MGVIFSMIDELATSALRSLITIPIIWLGEIVLFLVTAGKHKPRWDIYTQTGGGDFVFFSELSFWIGIVAICGIGGGIKLFFFTGEA